MTPRISPAPLRHRPSGQLLITLSDRLAPQANQSCIQRFQHFLQPLGLMLVQSPRGLVVRRQELPGCGIPSVVRGLVIGWLVAQPEFVVMTLAHPNQARHRQGSHVGEQHHG